MNETPTNQTAQTPEQARLADYASTGAPTQPTGAVPPQFAPPAPPPYQAPPYPPPSPDRVRRSTHGSIVGPVLLIGAGILFLLNNLGIVDWAVWGSLWRLWPLALIAVGLDMLFGRRRPWLSSLIVLGLLLASIGLLAYSSFGSGGSIAVYELRVPLSNAKSANVTLDLGAGDLNIDSQVSGDNLATGTLEYHSDSAAPDVTSELNGDSVDVEVRTNDTSRFNFFNFASTRSLRWDVHLNQTLPTALKADLGTGNTVLDLSNMKLTGLTVDGGTGNASITFPSVTQPTLATIDGGVGNLTLHIPEGTEARVTVDSGIGNVHVDGRFTKQTGDQDVYTSQGYDSTPDRLDLRVDAGVGNIEITR